jgi:hypothetical protein
MSFPEAKLQKLVDNEKAEEADGEKQGEQSADGEPEGTVVNSEKEGEQKGKPQQPAHVQGRKLSLSDLPVELQQMVSNAKRITEGEKNRLISVISANENNTLTDEQLQSLDVDILKGMAAVARGQATSGVEFDMDSLDYSGQGFPITNSADDDKDECDITPIPTFNAEAYNAARNGRGRK